MSEILADYLAVINVPGYLPMADDQPWFSTAQEAWEYLLHEREAAEQGDDTTDEYSDVVHELRYWAQGREGFDALGTVFGGTPGYDGDHDLGLVYSVVRVDHADYPHHAGYHAGCEACEARCHCDEESAQCVYEGEHS